jgi:predicted small lipoprotein YifL
MTTRSLCLLAVFALTSCGKKVPSDIQPTLEAIRPEARKVADAAAAACAAELKSGHFTVSAAGCSSKLLPGETVIPVVPSPAKGTSLESNPMVLDVETTCNAPTSPNESCGTSLGSLKGAFNKGPGANRTRNVVDGNCKSTSTDCEEVIVPSQSAADEASTDLRIVKPVSGGPAGATVEVRVILGKK